MKSVLLLLVVVILSIIACDDSTKPRKVTATITATDLRIEYGKNEARADADYKGKFIELTGSVSEIESGGFLNDPHLSLFAGASGYDTHEVRANFGDKGDLIHYDRGDSVTLICKVEGKDDAISGGVTITVKDCRKK